MDNFYYCKFQHIYFLVDLKVFLFENEEKKGIQNYYKEV